MNKLHGFTALVVSIILALSAGLAGSLATRPNIDTWYVMLDKPWFTPPGMLFPVVWLSLYLLMAVAAWMVYRAPEPGQHRYWQQGVSYESMLLGSRHGRGTALGFYGVQLLFNSLWPFIFFHWKLPGLALIEIVILLILIVITTRLFYRIRPLAGYLMIPYVLWVGFATVLNAAIWWMNS